MSLSVARSGPARSPWLPGGPGNDSAREVFPTVNGPVSNPDSELLRRIGHGDAAAFAEFYDRHAALLFGLAVKILLAPAEAEEVFQDSCVAIWERAPVAGAEGDLTLGWAVTLVRNRALDRLRSRQRRAELLEQAAPDLAPAGDDAGDANRLAEQGEAARAVRQALSALPAEQRCALELAYFEGLTQQEIAARLDQPLGTVKARIRRGMMALRDQLEGLP